VNGHWNVAETDDAVLAVVSCRRDTQGAVKDIDVLNPDVATHHTLKTTRATAISQQALELAQLPKVFALLLTKSA
jgi:hypothetical protein